MARARHGRKQLFVSPAGFDPGLPGTPIPQGQVPRGNMIADAKGLGAAIDYVARIGMHNVDRLVAVVRKLAATRPN